MLHAESPKTRIHNNHFLIEKLQQSAAADFSFRIWREVFTAVVRHERCALDTNENVEFELEVIQRSGACTQSESILKVRVVCEPGRPARRSAPEQSPAT